MHPHRYVSLCLQSEQELFDLKSQLSQLEANVNRLTQEVANAQRAAGTISLLCDHMRCSVTIAIAVPSSSSARSLRSSLSPSSLPFDLDFTGDDKLAMFRQQGALIAKKVSQKEEALDVAAREADNLARWARGSCARVCGWSLDTDRVVSRWASMGLAVIISLVILEL